MDICIDPRTFRNVLGHYPTGVCVVASRTEDGEPLGMVVGSFGSASLDPPLVSFFPARTSKTWDKIAATGRFCISVLSECQADLCRQFAGAEGERYRGVSHRLSPGGQPILDGAVAWIDCTIHAVHDAGDHVLVLGQVTALDKHAECGGPLLFFQGGYGRFTELSAERVA